MNIQQFHNRYVGREGWVFGRGRTTFDYSRIATISDPCFFINDAVAMDAHLSHSDAFWFALDEGHHKHLATMRSLPVLHRGGWVDKLPEEPSRACWWRQDPTAWNNWPMDLMAHAGVLYTKLGTICPLIHFAWFAGVRRLNLVGCDGLQTLDMSKPLNAGWDSRLPNLSGKSGGCVYGRIREQADELMDRLGVHSKYVGTPPLVIAYYTHEPYRVESENLRTSLLHLGIDHRIEHVEDRGSWEANTSAKPRFIRRMMDLHPGPIVYLDADAVVQSSPVLFNSIDPRAHGCVDVAVHYRERHFGEELLSGTVWLSNTQRCKEVVDQWIAACEADRGTWDQRHLQQILSNLPAGRVFRLPPEYCCIFDSMRAQHPGIVPVIEHFQASRRLKHREVAAT